MMVLFLKHVHLQNVGAVEDILVSGFRSMGRNRRITAVILENW